MQIDHLAFLAALWQNATSHNGGVHAISGWSGIRGPCSIWSVARNAVRSGATTDTGADRRDQTILSLRFHGELPGGVAGRPRGARLPEAKCRSAVGRMQNGGECDQSAAADCHRRASGRPSGVRPASGAGGTGGRTFARAPLRHAAAAHSNSGDLSRRRGAPVQQRAAGPRAHPRMSRSAGRELVARLLSRGRPRQHAIIERRCATSGLAERARLFFAACRARGVTMALRPRACNPACRRALVRVGPSLCSILSSHGLSRHFMHKLAPLPR